jgi:hypothetical protein
VQEARYDYSTVLNWLRLAALLAELSQNKVFPQNNSEKGLAKAGAYAFIESLGARNLLIIEGRILRFLSVFFMVYR